MIWLVTKSLVARRMRLLEHCGKYACIAIGWNLPQLGGVRLELVVDNLTDSDFEEFPGTLPSRRRFSVSVYYAW